MMAKIVPFFPLKARSPAELTADVIAHLVSRPDFEDAVAEAIDAIDALEARLHKALSRPGRTQISEATKSQLLLDITALRDVVGFWQAKIDQARTATE